MCAYVCIVEILIYILLNFSLFFFLLPNPTLRRIKAERRDSLRLRKDGGLQFVLYMAEALAQLSWSILGKDLERNGCVVYLERLGIRLWGF